MSVRVVVRPGDGPALRDVLRRLGETDRAVVEGRVFVDGRRASSAADPVQDGVEITVARARPAAAPVTVLAEHAGLFAVVKPVGLPTEPDRRGRASVVTETAGALGVPPASLHAVTRLDLPVSGIVLVARGADAARRAAALQRAGSLRRRYLALAASTPAPEAGLWDAPIGDGSRGRRAVRGSAARPARTVYRTIDTAGSAARVTLLVFEPLTGRTHQLRVHASAAGAPLLGDATYGGARRLVASDGRVLALARVALHAARVDLVRGGVAEWTVRAPHPTDLVELWAELGGSPAAFDAALTAPFTDPGPRAT